MSATQTVVRTKTSSIKGIRYFHSSFNIWSIRKRGNVQRTHIRIQTTKKDLPKNQKIPGIRFISWSNASNPIFTGAQIVEAKAHTGIFRMIAGGQLTLCLR